MFTIFTGKNHSLWFEWSFVDKVCLVWLCLFMLNTNFPEVNSLILICQKILSVVIFGFKTKSDTVSFVSIYFPWRITRGLILRFIEASHLAQTMLMYFYHRDFWKLETRNTLPINEDRKHQSHREKWFCQSRWFVKFLTDRHLKWNSCLVSNLKIDMSTITI